MLSVLRSVCLNLNSTARPHSIFKTIVCLVALYNNTNIIMAPYFSMQCLISINHEDSFVSEMLLLKFCCNLHVTEHTLSQHGSKCLYKVIISGKSIRLRCSKLCSGRRGKDYPRNKLGLGDPP